MCDLVIGVCISADSVYQCAGSFCFSANRENVFAKCDVAAAVCIFICVKAEFVAVFDNVVAENCMCISAIREFISANREFRSAICGFVSADGVFASVFAFYAEAS